MTCYARTWETDHTRSSPTNLQRHREALYQEPSGDGRFGELQKVVTKAENGKEAGSLEPRDGLQSHVIL